MCVQEVDQAFITNHSLKDLHWVPCVSVLSGFQHWMLDVCIIFIYIFFLPKIRGRRNSVSVWCVVQYICHHRCRLLTLPSSLKLFLYVKSVLQRLTDLPGFWLAAQRLCPKSMHTFSRNGEIWDCKRERLDFQAQHQNESFSLNAVKKKVMCSEGLV